ncbi:MAG TPA: branched-chain amino acid ABC transporter permease [Dehalococcoidales bacterium]|nr:branched-chain amino acid ABC transporter permease [Dehalococcoidales bacterium]
MNMTGILSKLIHSKWLVAGIALIILIVLALVPAFGNLAFKIMLITILMYLIMTVAWAMFSGPTGYISLAPAAFLGIGMYTAAVFGKDLPFSVLIIVAALFTFLAALIVGAVTLRLKGIYFTIFTFGLVFLIQQLLTWVEIKFTHTRGRFVVVVDNDMIYYHMLAILVITLLTAVFINRSKWGRALRSIGQDEDAASHTGVNVTMVKVLTFGLTSMFIGAAGAAIATRLTYIDPGSAFNINYSFFPVIMAIFGGMRNLYGPILGAVIFAYLEETLITQFPYYYMLIFGTVMVVVIMFLPDGLIGLWQKWRRGGRQKKHANT